MRDLLADWGESDIRCEEREIGHYESVELGRYTNEWRTEEQTNRRHRGRQGNRHRSAVTVVYVNVIGPTTAVEPAVNKV